VSGELAVLPSPLWVGFAVERPKVLYAA